MIRLTFMFALLLFSAFSCSKEDEEVVDPLDKYPAYISRVDAPETATVGSSIPITVYFNVNNGCGQFGSFKVEEKSDATYISVLTKYVGEICHQALVTRNVTYEFKPTAAGTYTFKFSPVHPDQIITKTIRVSSDGL